LKGLKEGRAWVSPWGFFILVSQVIDPSASLMQLVGTTLLLSPVLLFGFSNQLSDCANNLAGVANCRLQAIPRQVTSENRRMIKFG
jgi:hypothetical protein